MMKSSKIDEIVRKTVIDNSKLLNVMEIIKKANSLLEDECDTNPDIIKELNLLQKRLREITGKKDYDIKNVYGYWAYTDLESKASEVLLGEPERLGLPDEKLSKLILEILKSGDLEKETTMWYWFDFLDKEIGVESASDCLFDRNEDGKMVYAPIETIMDRIKKMRKR